MGVISFATGLAESPTLDVQVSLTIVGDVDLQPEKLVLMPGRTTEQKRAFFIQNGTKDPLKITDLAATNPEVKVSLEEVKPGTTFRVEVVVPATYRPSPTGDAITFKTNAASAPQMSIPVIEQRASAGGAPPMAVKPS